MEKIHETPRFTYEVGFESDAKDLFVIGEVDRMHSGRGQAVHALLAIRVGERGEVLFVAIAKVPEETLPEPYGEVFRKKDFWYSSTAKDYGNPERRETLESTKKTAEQLIAPFLK